MGAKNVIVTGIVSGNLVRDYIFGGVMFCTVEKPDENQDDALLSALEDTCSKLF